MLNVNGMRAALLAGCGLVALAYGAGQALAGGFAVREQSSEFQGSSNAGDAAAGGGLSGMFWNPAVAASAPKGYSSESDAAGIFGHSTETATNTPWTLLGLPTSSGNISSPALVPSSYMAYRLNQQTVLALSINSPFGLVTKVGNLWAGELFEETSDIKTYDYTPTVAYTIAPGLSVGAGLQIEQMTAHLTGYIPTAGNASNTLDGSDTKFGYTLGVNWEPSSATSIGLGYRSSVAHDLKGNATFPGASPAVDASIDLPDMLTASVRQSISSNARLLGTVEWTRWSNLQQLNVNCSTGTGAPPCPVSGFTLQSLPLNWHDGWMFALGGEYDTSRNLTLRTGLAYELSPMQDPTERTPRLPDQNRVTLSGGLTYKFSDMITVDAAYSHIWGLGGDINYTQYAAGQLPATLNANVSESVDLVSAALRFKLNP